MKSRKRIRGWSAKQGAERITSEVFPRSYPARILLPLIHHPPSSTTIFSSLTHHRRWQLPSVVSSRSKLPLQAFFGLRHSYRDTMAQDKARQGKNRDEGRATVLQSLACAVVIL